MVTIPKSQVRKETDRMTIAYKKPVIASYSENELGDMMAAFARGCYGHGTHYHDNGNGGGSCNSGSNGGYSGDDDGCHDGATYTW